jgi:hypothetical protein
MEDRKASLYHRARALELSTLPILLRGAQNLDLLFFKLRIDIIKKVEQDAQVINSTLLMEQMT